MLKILGTTFLRTRTRVRAVMVKRGVPAPFVVARAEVAFAMNARPVAGAAPIQTASLMTILAVDPHS